MGTRDGAHSRALTPPRAYGYEYVVAEIMGKGGAATCKRWLPQGDMDVMGGGVCREVSRIVKK